jgi:HEAT repeat protein
MSNVEALVEQLGDSNGMVRQKARLALVEIGAVAVPGLVRTLESPIEHRRWEAAKALSEIPDARATEALVRTLEDRAFGVRWLAANALIGIGEPVLAPLLRGLIDRPDSPRLRDGAAHVFRSLGSRDPAFKERVAAVLSALTSVEPASSVPWAARDVLKELGLIPK